MLMMLYYAFWLFLQQALAYYVIIALDYCCKYKNYTVMKRNFLFLRYKENQGDKISAVSFGVQLFNYTFLLAYTTIAVVHSFIYPTAQILSYINLRMVFIYGVVSFVACLIMAVITILCDGLRDDCNHPHSKNTKS